MDEALCSILCGEDEWYFDTGHRSIKFNKDGTGEVCKQVFFPETLTNHLEQKRCGVNAMAMLGFLQSLSGSAPGNVLALKVLLNTRSLNFLAS
jgi:hypothetical protein